MSEFPTNPRERFIGWHRRIVDVQREKLESSSGSGSSLEQTASVRVAIPRLAKQLNIFSLIDAPCGDFHWMQHCELGGLKYVGLDIIPEVIDRNRELYTSSTRTFETRNIISDKLPSADLILCRDCLVHMSFEQAFCTLRNLKRSGSRFLLTTTFTQRSHNRDLSLESQFWRPLNLQLGPFDFPAPKELIVENCTELDGAYSDKSLGLWELAELSV